MKRYRALYGVWDGNTDTPLRSKTVATNRAFRCPRAGSRRRTPEGQQQHLTDHQVRAHATLTTMYYWKEL